MLVGLQPNPINKQFYKDYSRYYYSIGGRWSGKTYDAILSAVFRLSEWPGTRAAFMRKVYGSIKDTLFSDTLDILRACGVQFDKVVHPLEIRFAEGSTIIFKGADDPEKLKGLSSVSIVLMDEANEFTESDFETIDQSIRGNHYHSIYLCHNPIPKSAADLFWFEKQFKVDPEPGKILRYYDDNLGAYVSTLRTTYKNNEHCPDHVKLRLEGYKNTNPALYKLWALGQYTELQGVILDNWDVVQFVPENIACIGYGLDFGFSQDPAALVQIWLHNDELYIKGLIYSTGLSNRELYDKMVSVGVGNNDIVIADSAEPKSIDELHRLGLRGIKGAKKRAGYKADMANNLKSYKIHIVDGDTDLKREISTWSWEKDKNGKDLPRPADGNDHYIDAMIMRMHEYRGTAKPITFSF